MSVGALALAGQLAWDGFVNGLVLLPFVFAGWAIAACGRRFVDVGTRVRGLVLVVSALAAIALLVRAAWG